MVNHYAKIWHVRLGVANNTHPLSWWGGGHKRKRSNLEFAGRSHYHPQLRVHLTYSSIPHYRIYTKREVYNLVCVCVLWGIMGKTRNYRCQARLRDSTEVTLELWLNISNCCVILHKHPKF